MSGCSRKVFTIKNKTWRRSSSSSYIEIKTAFKAFFSIYGRCSSVEFSIKPEVSHFTTATWGHTLYLLIFRAVITEHHFSVRSSTQQIILCYFIALEKKEKCRKYKFHAFRHVCGEQRWKMDKNWILKRMNHKKNLVFIYIFLFRQSSRPNKWCMRQNGCTLQSIKLPFVSCDFFFKWPPCVGSKIQKKKKRKWRFKAFLLLLCFTFSMNIEDGNRAVHIEQCPCSQISCYAIKHMSTIHEELLLQHNDSTILVSLYLLHGGNRLTTHTIDKHKTNFSRNEMARAIQTEVILTQR